MSKPCTQFWAPLPQGAVALEPKSEGKSSRLFSEFIFSKGNYAGPFLG